MDRLWILFVLIYSLMKGTRDGMKKAALKKSSSNEILFFYTLIGLILVLPFSKSAFTLAPIYIFYAFLKSAVVCTAWIFSFMALIFCIGCGKCIPLCPKGIIQLVDKSVKRMVVCSNTDQPFTTCSSIQKEEIIEEPVKKYFKIWASCYRIIDAKKK